MHSHATQRCSTYLSVFHDKLCNLLQEPLTEIMTLNKALGHLKVTSSQRKETEKVAEPGQFSLRHVIGPYHVRIFTLVVLQLQLLVAHFNMERVIWLHRARDGACHA